MLTQPHPTARAHWCILTRLASTLLSLSVLCAGALACAQTPAPPASPAPAAKAAPPAPVATPAPAPAPARSVAPAPAPGTTAAAPAPAKLKPEELEALVAPLALYPDPLLSQVLVASTYPLEIVQAQQWVAKNPSLKGDALLEGAKKQPWDPSVQSLVAFPDAVKRMSENITWTTNLGDAFLAQQSEVLDAVQRLRLKAKESGKLASTEQQTVTTKVVEKQTIVVIEPAKTEVVYVPVYDPALVWGPPAYPYPAVYYPPPPPAGAMLISFGVGMMIGSAMHGGWGYNTGWGHSHNNVVVVNHHNTFVQNSNRNNVNNINRNNSNWQHNPSHRGSVPYRNNEVAQRYGDQANRSRQSGYAPGPRNDLAGDRRPQAGTSDGRGLSSDGRSNLGNDGRGDLGNNGRGGPGNDGRANVSGSDRDFGGVDRTGGGRDSSSARTREPRSPSPAQGSRGASGGSRGGGRGGGRRR